MNITWEQFKKLIDDKLAQENISQDADLWFIDISSLSEESEISVFFDGNMGIWIDNT